MNVVVGCEVKTVGPENEGAPYMTLVVLFDILAGEYDVWWTIEDTGWEEITVGGPGMNLGPLIPI